jgi:hypothetical protein
LGAAVADKNATNIFLYTAQNYFGGICGLCAALQVCVKLLGAAIVMIGVKGDVGRYCAGVNSV